MRGKGMAQRMGRLAALLAVPVVGAASAQAGEQAADPSAAVQPGVPFAQIEMVSPVGPYGLPPGAAGTPPYAGGPWGGPPGGGAGMGYAPPGPHSMMGPGMMQGQQGGAAHSMEGEGAFGMRSVMQASQLPDLSEEQRTKLRSIGQELRKKQWDLKGAMIEESEIIAELWAAEPVDAGAVGDAYGRYFELRRQWIVSAIETRQQVDNVLTDEQKQWLHGRPAMPGAALPMMPPAMTPPAMMPPGMMPPGMVPPGMMPPGMMPGVPGMPGAAPAVPAGGGQDAAGGSSDAAAQPAE
ncbi:MAG: Spy/CpxP family protein refolding chaperone [Gammaproteobacteria bacterium]